jgi:phosphoglucosamine mutase
VMPRFPQMKENVRVGRKQLSPALIEAVAKHNEELHGRGRVLVRPSGTEPVVRVLAEARDEAEAASLCASIAALVRRELG